MVMLRIGYEYAGFAATTSTTKGEGDTFNPSSVESKRDSRRYSDDGSQGSKSDTSSEDQHSNEDGGSTSTEESSDHHFDFPFEFPDEKGSKADTHRASEQLRMEIRMASLPVRNEVFRLRTENKDLRGQICDARTEINKVGKFSRFQKSLITRFEDNLQDLRLREQIEDREFRYEPAAIGRDAIDLTRPVLKIAFRELLHD